VGHATVRNPELVKLADDLGYDSVSFTEHHFHIEGSSFPTTLCC
jgi:alkanesulfonate monooxygenase SsuD/methylene tetrahydromethanopterin reductase-like flavin-dependent oxidoreductase (luciferase family)